MPTAATTWRCVSRCVELTAISGSWVSPPLGGPYQGIMLQRSSQTISVGVSAEVSVARQPKRLDGGDQRRSGHEPEADAHVEAAIGPTVDGRHEIVRLQDLVDHE